MKAKFQQLYMDIARRVANLSHARRLQVGCVIVKDDRVISMGYNGMPAGWDNDCEEKEYYNPANGYSGEFASYEYDHLDEDGSMYKLKTKPEVLHAESNALAKLARSVESGLDSDLFVTHSPCLDCAKLIYQSGIQRVYFGHAYRDNSGLDFLSKSGVDVVQLD
jgi:dCMP deaminase